MGDPHYSGGALLSLSEASLAAGDVKGALAAALRAQGLSSKSGMLESEWRAWSLAAQAARRLGGKSGEYAARAQSVLSDIERRWGAESFAGYLSRRDVRRQSLGLSRSE